MNKQNKKGLSTVVATLLIILVTISVGTLIANFIIPYVKNNLQESGECVDYRDYFSFQRTLKNPNTGMEYNYNCEQNNLVGFSIKAKALTEEKTNNLDGFRLVLQDAEGITRVVNINENSIASTQSLGVWTLGEKGNLNLDPPKSGEIISYTYNKGNTPAITIVKASVYPVLKNGRLCELSSETIISPCSSGVNLDQ